MGLIGVTGYHSVMKRAFASAAADEPWLIVSVERLFGIRARGAGLALGIGDDCAAIVPPRGTELLISTDTLVENVHFRRAWAAPRLIGSKAVTVTVSDIAAMGGTARFLLVSLVFPHGETRQWLGALLRGIQGAARRHGVRVIGGNVAASDGPLSITLTATGEVKKGARVDRSGAKPGDAIYLSGTPGDAGLGLWLLEQGQREPRGLVRRHLSPEPRLAWGALLASRHIASAMIDISDGVALDLLRMMKSSGVRGRVELARIPFSRAARAVIKRHGQPALARALTGGEDYELAFTVPPGKEPRLARLIASGKIRAARVGQVRGGRVGIEFVAPGGGLVDFAVYGWEHR